jgi:hypothetical protein
MPRTRTARCRAKEKDACPFHGNSFHDDTTKRLKSYMSDVKDYGLPRNLSMLASDWNDRHTHGFASAMVAYANPDLDLQVRSQMMDIIGNEQSDMLMLSNSTREYKKVLSGAVHAFDARKAQEAAQDTDEATKIANLSNYLNSQIFGANAEADKLRAEMAKVSPTIWPEERRMKLSGQENQMLAQEALAYRLTEVRTKLDAQFKRTARKAPPMPFPGPDWFANASEEELAKAAKTEPRIPIDWMAPLPGEKAPETFAW